MGYVDVDIGQWGPAARNELRGIGSRFAVFVDFVYVDLYDDI
jgi:hypothetical protein